MNNGTKTIVSRRSSYCGVWRLKRRQVQCWIMSNGRLDPNLKKFSFITLLSNVERIISPIESKRPWLAASGLVCSPKTSVIRTNHRRFEWLGNLTHRRFGLRNSPSHGRFDSIQVMQAAWNDKPSFEQPFLLQVSNVFWKFSEKWLNHKTDPATLEGMCGWPGPIPVQPIRKRQRNPLNVCK